MNPDVKNPNSKLHPEFFVCDDCEFAGEPAVSHNRGDAPATAQSLSGNSVSRGHGVQGDPAPAATLGTPLALETAAGIQLEQLADVGDEGENGWNAHRRGEIARKMQRIAAGVNHYSYDELEALTVRAEERTLAEVTR